MLQLKNIHIFVPYLGEEIGRAHKNHFLYTNSYYSLIWWQLILVQIIVSISLIQSWIIKFICKILLTLMCICFVMLFVLIGNRYRCSNTCHSHCQCGHMIVVAYLNFKQLWANNIVFPISFVFFPFIVQMHCNISVTSSLTIQQIQRSRDEPYANAKIPNNFPVNIKAKFMTPYISSLSAATGSVTSSSLTQLLSIVKNWM